jgi:RNA polymerase sigma-70 factor (sigma-E family)
MGRGAEEDFHIFVESSGSDLARLARLLVPHPDDAEDLLQASLLRVWRAWSRVAAATDRLSYVRRVMVNAAISRGRSRDRAVPLHPLPEHPASDATEGVADRLALVQALRTLAPRQRCAVVLRYYCDLDDASIAEMLGCSASTVRSQIHRGLAHLRVAEHAEPAGRHTATLKEPT